MTRTKPMLVVNVALTASEQDFDTTVRFLDRDFRIIRIGTEGKVMAGSAKSTGTQSATSTTRARSVAVVTTASHSGGSAGHGPSTTSTCAPWHWFMNTSRSAGSSSSAASRARLIDTWSGSSPTWRARLSPSNGAELTPPDRSVTANWMPSRRSWVKNTTPR